MDNNLFLNAINEDTKIKEYLVCFCIVNNDNPILIPNSYSITNHRDDMKNVNNLINIKISEKLGIKYKHFYFDNFNCILELKTESNKQKLIQIILENNFEFQDWDDKDLHYQKLFKTQKELGDFIESI